MRALSNDFKVRLKSKVAGQPSGALRRIETTIQQAERSIAANPAGLSPHSVSLVFLFVFIEKRKGESIDRKQEPLTNLGTEDVLVQILNCETCLGDVLLLSSTNRHLLVMRLSSAGQMVNSFPQCGRAMNI